MESHNQIIELMDLYQVEMEKFKEGNKSAATRARKALSEISRLCREIRKDIQEQKNMM
tara:strand:- start:4175 stop:4348 length:174 start_codon:yes stop_codon:yes gene_type:complete